MMLTVVEGVATDMLLLCSLLLDALCSSFARYCRESPNSQWEGD